MRATLSALLLAAAASTATAHGHEGHAKAHQEYARAAAVDTSTLKGKWLYGYQGWFRKPAAGVNNHWSPNGGTPGPGNVEFEFVPDVSQYPANCLFASTLKAPNGQPVQLYDNTCQGVVDLHFKWMQQYGIDGIVVQRFLSHLDDTSFITVLNQVEAAAVKYGRGFMVEYDASGGNSATGSVAAQILADYNSKVKPYTTSSAYIHHNGKPAVMVFGVGYTTVAINVTDGANIATQLKGAGAYVGYGVPPTFGTDLRANTGFAAAYKAANLISPWTVGSFSEGGYLKGYHTTTQIPDSQTLHSLGIDHAPLIWPGTSAYHLNGATTPSSFDYFPRYNGSFYSMQADAITSLAIKPLFAFNAMFDEINEGTQSLPCLKNNQLPTNEKFVGYDNNFADTAFYLELGGQKGAAFAAAVN
ncbi:uncharacterized protein TRIVIDRAFT_28185 [Trichoderma virens Gv29-8]|uniref:Uncharacterized protein n=1 Tax=Hypocrea virens (strain Gv29-8 / FGSC 10586) TaxID=413071 RepID=G9MS71_HYPVG|nr:uncharacterized protein TRIVIDRAFT_28185 [Trichoderma virens Gv29-8]EHK22933.1 hypothetical protein TRIVIDRAFT_28185 [Trichoderma virens Gv29-8]UKZ47983.1 hypothetical protein TrVGV298_002219 [Trichoderma virens]